MSVVKEIMLVLTEADANSNKYYKAVLQADGTFEANWGRVGVSKGQSKTYSGGEGALEKKLNEKRRKGYKDVPIVTNATAPTAITGNLQQVAKQQIQHGGCAETAKLVDLLVKVNAHQITTASGGQLNVDLASGQVTTPVGILQQSAIDQGRSKLDEIASLHLTRRDEPLFKNVVQDYLMLVPQVVPRQRGWLKTMFVDAESIQRQNALLDSLEATIRAISTNPAAPAAVAEKVFDVKLSLINDQQILDRISKLYRNTRQGIHQSSRLDVARVFSVQIADMQAAFETDGARLSNIWELWHGTRAANLLSILKSGLVIPRSGAAHVTGRMFSDGIYASDQSTKALNYATGYWSGGASSHCYMFLLQMAMGKYYTPPGPSSQLPKAGYDSTFAKAGQSGVLNNEMIVYRTSQVNLQYLVEFA